MAFSAAARRKGAATQKANREAAALAKQKEVLPETAKILDYQAMLVISEVAKNGNLLEAAGQVRGVTFADVIIFLRSKPEWVNALEAAEATYAKEMSRAAVDVANEPIPWGEIQGWDLDAQKLYLQAWGQRQKLRVETMRGMAQSLAPKTPAGPAVSVSVDASRREPAGAYATMLQAVEQVERSKVIEHKEEG